MNLLISLTLALLAAAPPPPATHLVVALPRHDFAADVSLPNGPIARFALGQGALSRSPLLAVGDRLVYVDGIEHEPQAVSIGLSSEHPRTVLGYAGVVIPSATRSRLWLGRLRSPTPQPSLLSLREITPDGRTTFAVRHETPGERLVGAVRDGLVFARPHKLVVWDPRTGRTVRTFPGRHLVAAQGSQLALCRGRCFGLRLVGGPREGVVRAPGGRRFVRGRIVLNPHRAHFLRMSGAFSPDGRLLAVPVEPRGRPRLALVDTRRGTASWVPHTRLQGFAAPLAWAPSGRLLYFAGAHGRVFTYVPGARRAQRLDLPFRQPISQLLVAE